MAQDPCGQGKLSREDGMGPQVGGEHHLRAGWAGLGLHDGDSAGLGVEGQGPGKSRNLLPVHPCPQNWCPLQGHVGSGS